MEPFDNSPQFRVMGRPRQEHTSQSSCELLNMVGNQVLSVIDPDFIWNATEWLVFCDKHASADRCRHQKTIRRIIAKESCHDQAGSTINHQRQIWTDLARYRAMGR